MPTPQKKGPFIVCPKSGRIVGFAATSRWRFLWLPGVGLAALLWILVRVIPKPSRANYPCQQAAIPLASGFIGYLLSFPAAVLACRKGRENARRARYFVAMLCFLTAGVAGIVHLCVASPYTVVWSNAPAGADTITAVARDTNNFSGLSAPVSVRAE